MKINLIITQKQQIRSWLNNEFFRVLQQAFEIKVYAPLHLEKELKFSFHNYVNFYSVPTDQRLDRAQYEYNLTQYLNHKSFRYMAYEYLKFRKVEKFGISSIKIFYEDLIRILKFFRDKYIRHFRLKKAQILDSHIKSIQIPFAEADINLVIANLSDIRTNVVSSNLNKNNAKWVLIPENWDNISSKLIPNYDPSYLAVWSQQTLRQANSIYGYPAERISVIGSPRLQNDKLKFLLDTSKAPKTHKEKITIYYPGAGLNYEKFDFINAIKHTLDQESSTLKCEKLIFRPHPLALKENGKDY